MSDIEKTKAQLMDELGLLRQRIAELEAAETERRRAEEEVKRARDNYLSITNLTGDIIVTVNTEGRWTFLNDGACQFWGKTRQELMGSAFADYLHPDDQGETAAAVQKVRSGETVTGFVNRQLTPDGWRTVEWNAAGLFDSDGQFTGFQPTGRDVTKRKQVERELIRLSDAVKMSSDSIVVGDLQGRIVNVNQAALEMCRAGDKRDLIGENSLDLIAPQDREQVLQDAAELQENRYVKDREYHIVAKDGSQILVELSSSLLRERDGELMGFVAVARDITQRKRAEGELRKHRDHLEELVAERSTELQTANEQLRRELARRKRVEKAQKLSEAKYRALFEEAADPFVVIDAETGAMVEFNQRAHQNLGHSREEFEKLRICDIDVIQSAEDVATRIQKTATEGTVTFETKHRTKSGEIRDVQIAAGGLSIHGRHFIQSVWHDITERRRAEERVRESEELYRSLVELSPDTVAVQSKGKIVFVNSAGARLVGAAHVEQLLGMPVADFLHPDYRETVAERLRKAAEEGTSRPLIEQKFIRLDGTEVDVEVAAMPLTYQGKPAMQLVARDITERKQAEEALRRSEERYRTILEEMEDSYFEVDIAGNFAFVNDATCHSLGYPRDEVIGMDYRRYVADEDVETVYRAFNQVYRTGKPRRGFSYKVTRKDGSTGFVEISVFPVRNKEGDITGFRGIGRDITDRRKAEAKIEGALREKEVLLKEIHHRVKNNMQIISSLLNLQAKRVTSREAADILRRSQSRVRSMALIHEALYQSEDLARIDFHRYIRNLADDLFTLYSVKRGAVKLGIDVDNICLDINTAIPCGLVINELVSNSLKHAFPNDREGEIRIGFRSGKDGGMILTVSDNGVGFPNLDFRDTETVGLQLVTTLVAQLGSTIELDRNGKTTFRMRFREP